MGAVYLAEDLNLGRQVAIKFLSPERAADPEFRKRFVHEAKAQAMLSHSNITTFHEVGEEKDTAFLVMEYVEGQSLSELAKQEKLSLSEILDITIQAGEGLQAAHEKGLIHRDIKPANILLNSKRVVKITDFGLAKWEGATTLTQSGAQVGTACYMSPEQVKGAKVDQRSDIFSFGVVLYELLCAKRPFEGDSKQAIFYELLYTEPHPLARYSSKVPQGLQEIVSKCLAKKPEERYQSSADLVADLKRIKREVTSGETAFGLPGDGRLFFRRTLRKILLPLAVVPLILMVLFLLPWSRNSIKRLLGIGTIPSKKNLAVLPFTNVGGDPTNQPFCDGLGEALNNKLSQLERFHRSLRVVPVSDARKYKVYGAEEARKIFGVTLAVSGNVQATGNRVRLTINLIDTKTLWQLRSSIGDYQMANFASLEDQTVRKIATMLEIELPPQALLELGRGSSSVSSAYVFYLRGRGYLQQYEKPENLDLAIGLFERALKEDPLYGLAYAGFGEAYWRKYEATKNRQWIQLAVNNCTQAVQLNEHQSPAHITLGVIHTGSGRYQKAVGEFQKALEYDSLNVEAYRGLAGAYEALGETDKAEATYQRAIKLRPSYPIGYSYLGAFYFHHGRYDEGVAQFLRVVELTPENIKGYNNLGAVYIKLGRWLEARGMFERSLKIQPNYAAYSNLGTLYFFQVAGYADAARMYLKALELDSSDYRVRGNLASAYYWAPGERAKAHTVYQHAARLAEKQRKVNPRDAVVLSDLANFYGMMGEFDKALPLLDQSLALAPGDVEVMARASETYEQLGQRKKALEWIGKALNKGYQLEKVVQSPGLYKLREDPRFQRLTKELTNKPKN